VFVDLYLKERMIERQAMQLRRRERAAFERRNEMRFRTLIDAMPQCVWAARLDGLFHYWNKQAVDYTGIAVVAPTPIGVLLEAVHPDDRGLLENALNEALRGGRGFDIKFRLRRCHDRSFRWHLARGLPQRNESDAITGWIMVATDIDSEQQALEKAEATSQMKDEFLAMVSHELRNPLNAITGWVRLLRSGKLDQPGFAKAIETIERNAQLQTALINDLLDVARITRGRVNLNFQPLRLAPIIEATLAAIRPMADTRGVEIESEVDESDNWVKGDQDRLQQVAWNLLSNAVKFTPHGGKVTARLSQDDRDLIFSVSDTGQGINPSFLPFVFEQFRQADNATTRAHGGLGLGLAIVRHLVELHGGSVSAESKGEGKGATFTVRLPLSDARERTRNGAKRKPGQLSLQNVKVMLVEDEADSREMLAEVLTVHGARVITAASCEEALEKIEAAAPQVLLSDIAMPHEDGCTLVRKLRERMPESRMVIAAVTGLSGVNEKRLLNAGFQLCFTKPVDPDQLVQSIAKLLH
jgi:PAS domain S-box-containing protein